MSLDTTNIEFEDKDVELDLADSDDEVTPQSQTQSGTKAIKPVDERAHFAKLMDYKHNYKNVVSLTPLLVRACRKHIIDNASKVFEGISFANKAIMESLKIPNELPGAFKIHFIATFVCRKNVTTPTSIKDYNINISIKRYKEFYDVKI